MLLSGCKPCDVQVSLSQSKYIMNGLQDEPGVLLKLCQSVGKQEVLQTLPTSTVHSLSEAFILGRQHQSRATPVLDAVRRKEGLTARMMSNPHVCSQCLRWGSIVHSSTRVQHVLLSTTRPHYGCAAESVCGRLLHMVTKQGKRRRAAAAMLVGKQVSIQKCDNRAV